LRFAQARGLGQKVSDEFTVPLCRAHHRELHRAGTEVEWRSRLGIEPLQAARTLWLATHALPLERGKRFGRVLLKPIARPDELFMRPVG
jgi:hypothetical protein